MSTYWLPEEEVRGMIVDACMARIREVTYIDGVPGSNKGTKIRALVDGAVESHAKGLHTRLVDQKDAFETVLRQRDEAEARLVEKNPERATEPPADELPEFSGFPRCLKCYHEISHREYVKPLSHCNCTAKEHMHHVCERCKFMYVTACIVLKTDEELDVMREKFRKRHE